MLGGRWGPGVGERPQATVPAIRHQDSRLELASEGTWEAAPAFAPEKSETILTADLQTRAALLLWKLSGVSASL